jgi:hypothetical protein
MNLRPTARWIGNKQVSSSIREIADELLIGEPEP